MIPTAPTASWVCTLLLAVGLGLVGCAEGEVAEPAAETPRFTGAQIDRMQQAARDAGLVRAEWLNILGADDGRRAVVHASITTMTRSEVGEYCSAVRAAIAPEVLPGQTLEMYLILADGIAACP